MNERGNSDSLIVPGKLPNKGCGALRPAEKVEGRGLAEGNPIQQNRLRTQSRNRPATCVGRCGRYQLACASLPEVGAQCGSSARWDLCGGCRVTGIPTAIPEKQLNTFYFLPLSEKWLNPISAKLDTAIETISAFRSDCQTSFFQLFYPPRI